MVKPQYLGRNDNDFRGFDTFEAPPHLETVSLETSDVTAICPVTAQPDFYTIEVQYNPDGLCIETKSFKLYLQQFRNEGIYCEALASRILSDVRESLDPYWVTVEVKQQVRGGIVTTAIATTSRDSSDNTSFFGYVGQPSGKYLDLD